MKLSDITNQDWIERYDPKTREIRVGIRSGDDIVPPEFLYRIMSLTELQKAKDSGYFRPLPGERIHASSRPVPAYSQSEDDVIVKLRYSDDDDWKAKWGMAGSEIYAVTDKPIPIDRMVDVSSVHK